MQGPAKAARAPMAPRQAERKAGTGSVTGASTGSHANAGASASANAGRNASANAVANSNLGQGRAAAPAPAPAASSAAQRFDRMALRAPAGAAPAVSSAGPLPVSQPGDAVEREADQVAARVLRMPAGAAPPQIAHAPPAAARAPAPPAQAAAGGAAAADPAALVARLGTGTALDAETRAFFEPRLNADLGAVRIHADADGDAAARALGARAFAWGEHLAFASGEHDPASPGGRALLAHELVHVLQQRQGGLQVMRDGPGTTAPATAPAPAAATGKGPITLPEVRLPDLKYGSDPANAHSRQAYVDARPTLERPAGYRRADLGADQSGHWRRQTPRSALQTGLSAKVAGLEADKTYVAAPRSVSLAAAGERVIVGNPAQLADALRQPRWDSAGQAEPHPLEIDHIVELQLGGIGLDNPANLELLERTANGASGGAIDRALDAAFVAYAASDAAQALPAEDRNAEVLRRDYKVRYASFVASGAPNAGKRWTRDKVLAGDPVLGLKIYDPANLTGAEASDPNAVLQRWPAAVDAARYTGSPNTLVIYATPRGGAPRAVPLRDGQPADAAGALRGLVAGMDTDGLTLSLTGADTGAIGHVTARLTAAALAPGAKADFQVPITRRRGLVNAGVLNTEAPTATLQRLLREHGITAASPVVVDSVDIEPGIGLLVIGRVQPTIELLRRATLDFQIRGNELIVSKTFSGGELALGGPFHIDGSDLTLAIGTASGVAVDGGVAFSIARLGRGTLRGAGRSAGFAIDGQFDFDRTLFDADARINLRYARNAEAPDGKLSGSGLVSIGPGKVRGLRRANINASFDGDQRSLTGTAELDIPGVESATMGVEFTPDRGTVISGSARFRDRPGIRNGQISATLTDADGGWRLAASGSAQASFAGVTAALAASYDDGLFMFSGEAPFRVGDRVSGDILVGVTNGQVDEASRVVPGSGPPAGTLGELRPFGHGNVNVRITDWLQGGVGLRVLTTGELLVSGRIGIPSPVTVFDQFPSPERARRTLFTMPTVSVPIVGLSVGGSVVGIALTITGRVTGFAHVGPGRLTQTEINVIDFNPAVPESLHVTGGATFEVPAAVGVGAQLDAGLSLGAAIIRATAGLSLAAEAGVQANVAPRAEIDWQPSTGLHLHAELNASLAPRLAFSVNGYAEVVADAWVTSWTLWRKDWRLAQREIGSALALRLNAPLDWYSDGRGVVFDPERVTFQLPTLDADTLHQVMNAQGGTESARRD